MSGSFYLDPGAASIDWESLGSLVLANPEWVRRQADGLAGIERRLPALEAHIWVSTSGTSSLVPGRVRWIALSKAAFLASAGAVNRHLDAARSDVWAHALPTFHVGGLGILARGWLNGARVVPAVVGKWSAARFCEIVGRERATLAALVPSQVHDLVAAGLASPPSMRAIVVGGARMDAALYERARALGWPCLPSYGLTETCSQVATAAPASLAATGRPTVLPVLGHAQIRSDDDARLAIRATSLLTCCAEINERGARVWDPKQDGWLPTDDTGRVGPDGVEVFGRVSEAVKVLGEIVSLPRVEDQAWRWATEENLRALEGFDLAVVAPSHDRLGHEVVLAIACREPMDAARRSAIEESIGSYGRDRLLPFERVRRVAWVDEIPRTALGKCRRVLLTRQVGEQAGVDL
jgi:O-succinylbenzoic acid--CoA ligase